MTEPASETATRSSPRGGRKRKLWRISYYAIFMLVTLTFRLWDDSHLPKFFAKCNDDQANAVANVGFAEWVYGPLMRFRYHAPPPRHVAIISITSGVEPLRILTNVCDSRKFIGDLVAQLALMQPVAIVIDKYYTAGACVDEVVNDSFRLALNAAGVPPVIAGQASYSGAPPGATGADSDRDCLVKKPPFDFAHTSAGNAPAMTNVHLGLTLLNRDDLKIPLRWWALSPEQASSGDSYAEKPTPGIAYLAASLADRSVLQDKNLQRYLQENEHPYGSFSRNIPTASAMSILCKSKGGEIVQQHQWGSCSQVAPPTIDLRGKIAVIGEFSNTDLQAFSGGPIQGVQLQANYIESILEDRYIREMPWYFDLALALLAVFFEVFLDDLAEVKFLPTWIPDARALLLDMSGVGLALSVCFIAFVIFGIFTPILLISAGSIVATLFLRAGQLGIGWLKGHYKGA